LNRGEGGARHGMIRERAPHPCSKPTASRRAPGARASDDGFAFSCSPFCPVEFATRSTPAMEMGRSSLNSTLPCGSLPLVRPVTGFQFYPHTLLQGPPIQASIRGRRGRVLCEAHRLTLPNASLTILENYGRLPKKIFFFVLGCTVLVTRLLV
jgi:hypothetical protein